jgi:hypothetical protein
MDSKWSQSDSYPPSFSLVNKLKDPVFIWTMVRDPLDRAMSAFYHFEASDEKTEVSASEKIKYLKKMDNYMWTYLRGSDSDSVEGLMKRYHVLGTTELFDQTMVLLAHALSLPLSLFMYLPSKVADKTAKPGKKSYVSHIPWSEEPQEVRNYKSTFKENNKKDYKLWREATKLVHHRIEKASLGKYVVEFTKKNKVTFETCGPTVKGKLDEDCRMPCGLKCIVSDDGCGYKCINKHQKKLCVKTPWHESC